MPYTPTLDEIEEELRRKGEVTGPSVMDTSNRGELSKLAESVSKGAAKGVLSLLGGWGGYYDYLKGNKKPSAFSGEGLTTGVKKLTGIDLNKVSGYKGAHEMASSALPQTLITAVAPEFGLFASRAPLALAGEAGVNALTGSIAQSIAPNSPVAQMGIQMTPYGLSGLTQAVRNKLLTPTGTFSGMDSSLLDVGRMTPGEYSGSRVQLAKEGGVAANPKTEQIPVQFKKAQAKDAESYLSNLFSNASKKGIKDPTKATEFITEGVEAYGKNLKDTMKKSVDSLYNLGYKLVGNQPVADTAPVIKTLRELASEYGSSTMPQDKQTFAKYLNTLADRFETPAVTDTLTNTQIPAGSKKLTLKELQSHLEDWGEASYGKGAKTLTDSVSPGTLKGVARKVLSSFYDVLDNTASNWGSAEGQAAISMQKARESFASQLAKVKEFEGLPIVKQFGVPASELDATKAVEIMKNMTPTMRASAMKLLGTDAPILADTIRHNLLSDILKNAQVTGEGATASSFNIRQALKELQKSDNNFLFETPAEKANALKAVSWMQKVIESEGGSLGGIEGADVYRGIKATGGDTASAAGGLELFNWLKNKIASPEDMAKIIFDKGTVPNLIEAQGRTPLEKRINRAKYIGSLGAVAAERGTPSVDTGKVEVLQDTPEVKQPTLEEIEAAIAAKEQSPLVGSGTQ